LVDMVSRPRDWTVDASSYDVLSHVTNMTPRKRRQWARTFIGARHHGFSGLELLLFALACARNAGSAVPLLVALRVVPRVKPLRERSARSTWPVWRIPATWPPRMLGAVAIGIALWGLLAPHPEPLNMGAPPEWSAPESFATDWLSRDGGTIAVPMPPTRLEKQQAPPCLPASAGDEEINGGCWSRMERRPPCGQFYEHKGRCYVPVRETPKPPTSVGP
jgi:hypothetical protein